MKRLTILLLLLLAGFCAQAAEDNNPCLHPEGSRKNYRCTGSLSLTSPGKITVLRCNAPVNVCDEARNNVTFKDTCKQQYDCGACNHTITEDQPHSDHNPVVSASRTPAVVSGAGTFTVTTHVECSGCNHSASKTMDVVIEHQPTESFECDASVTWYVGPGAVPNPSGLPDSPQACSLTLTQAQGQAPSLGKTSGSCKKTTVCSACQQTLSTDSNNFKISHSATRVVNGYKLSKHVRCHSMNETRDYTIALTHSDMELGESNSRDCSFIGTPTWYSVQDKNISIPVNMSAVFNVAFSAVPITGTGYHEFHEFHCERCQESFSFPANDLPRFEHLTETKLPPLTGSGILLNPQPQYPYVVNFPTTGETEVEFIHECKEHTIPTYTHYGTGLTFTNIKIPGCSDSKAGEFIFDVKVMTVDSLVVSSEHETGAESSFELPELDEIDPEPTESCYVRAYKPATEDSPAEWETILKATPTPSGTWPGGKPTWKRYPKVSGADPIYTIDPNDPGRALVHAGPGAYVFVARCEANGETDPAYAKSLALYVVDPQVSVEFKASGGQLQTNQAGEKILISSICSLPTPVELHLTVNPNGLPDGIQAKVSFDSPDNPRNEVFEVYKDRACTEKIDPAALSWTVDSEQDENDNYLNRNRVYYVKVLGPEDPDDLIIEFKVKMEYGLEGKLQEKGEDAFKVIWERNCADGTCAAGSDASMDVNADGPRFGFSFGKGLDGKTGGVVQMKHLGSTFRVDKSSTFAYAANTIAKLGANGIPIRVMTGNYQTELSYIGSAFIAKQYLSTNMDPEVAATGVPVFEFIFDFNPYPDGGISVTSVKMKTIRNFNGTSQTKLLSTLTAYDSTIPGLSGTFFARWYFSSDSDGTSYFGFRDYTENGVAYRREGGSTVGKNGGPVLVFTDTIKRKFSWGYSVVSETDGSGTTTYEYYDTGSLKKMVYPNGESTSYTYDGEDRMLTATTVRGSITTVTNYTYSKDPATGGLVTNSTSTVGATEISRSRSITHAFPGANPNISIRYGENNVELTTSTWYVSDTESPFYNRISRQVNPDGTETRYTYARGAETDTVTVESGVFTGNTLTLGNRTVTVSNQAGVTISTAGYAIEGEQTIQTAGSENTAFDDFGRATATQYLDGSTSTRTYGCCGVESETDRDGVTTTYAYNAYGRVSHTVRDGITTLYTYDGAGQQTAVTVKGRDGGEITTTTEYDNGLVSATVDALGNRTAYTRAYATSGNTTTYTETVTNPDGSTQVTTTVNGELSGVSGTAVHEQTFTYGANWQMATTPVANEVNMTVKSYTDMLGRNFKIEYADGTYSINDYNSKNQLVKSVTPGGVTTLYAYDSLGRQTTQAIDMNANGTIDSADLTTSTAYSYGTQSGKQVAVTVTTRSQGSESTVISTTKQSVDGLDIWTTNMAGLTTHTKNERLGSGVTRRTVTNPDGTKIITNMTNGKVTSVQQVNSDDSLGNLSYSYDEFNRVIGVIETNDQTTVNTTASTYNANGAVLTQTVNGQTTSYVYNNMGRQTSVTAPGNVVTNIAYFPTGEIRRVDGATYPVEYTYNGLGQQATMTTFKDASTPQVTSWTYNNRGVMTAKTYADNNAVTYTYTADGQLLTRTWARQVNNQPLVTTYAYDAAGRQTGYSYSDGVTPSVSWALNYLDQVTAITDAAGTRNFSYNSNYRLANETNPVIVNGVMNYTYDAYGRRTGTNLTDGTVRAQAEYTYDTAGRIVTVGDDGDTLTYTYAPGTNRATSTTWTTATGNNTAYIYDSYYRLTGIAVNNTPVYGYTLNEKNQRTGATLENGDNWAYIYDMLGQLTGALKKDSQNNTLNNMSYAFDLIGNRTSAVEDATNWAYASNLLNQYTQVNALLPTYDADGNMLTWNGWTYTWNGENRLIVAENDDTKVEMSYDYMGRRFEKKVYTKGLLNFYTWTLQKHRKFAYDDYKLIAEFDAMNNDTLSANYLWQPVGLDVPLRATIDGDAYYFITDGNKNIIALKDATGATVDDYTYTPFGVVTTSGTIDNPFRFSSEYYDGELGLVYYNYRYYNPTLGRWIKRDPIEEDGGVNLYGFVENTPITQYDILGFYWKGAERNVKEDWYKVERTSRYDAINKLTTTIQLDVEDAFGEDGWLREFRDGEYFTITKEDFETKRPVCFGVPNIIVVQLGKGADAMTKTKNQVVKELEPKGFKIADSVVHGSTYAVIYIGHFDISTGEFKPDGDPWIGKPAKVSHSMLKEAVGHKIAFFAGVGCMSELGKWENIVSGKRKNSVWATNYYMNIDNASREGINIRSRYEETKGPQDKWAKGTPGVIGNAGQTLGQWIANIK